MKSPWATRLQGRSSADAVVLQRTSKNQLAALRALFTPLHMQAPYRRFDCSVLEASMAEHAFNTTILLPSGNLE